MNKKWNMGVDQLSWLYQMGLLETYYVQWHPYSVEDMFFKWETWKFYK